MLTACGCDCGGCPSYQTSCPGCEKLEGKVFWAQYTGSDVCPMYQCCVNDKRYAHCGECSELPCKLYYDTQDPSTTKEEHEAGVMQRVNNLKKNP